jgi:hypothetical protein
MPNQAEQHLFHDLFTALASLRHPAAGFDLGRWSAPTQPDQPVTFQEMFRRFHEAQAQQREFLRHIWETNREALVPYGIIEPLQHGMGQLPGPKSGRITRLPPLTYWHQKKPLFTIHPPWSPEDEYLI